jgi:hypothetical protein
MAKARITIPVSPRDLINLCQAIGAEHKDQGKDSPLSILKWDEINPRIAEADEVESKVTELNRELDKLIERRNTLIETPEGLADFARQSRDILSGVYRNEMKKLGDFGFEVTDSPKAKKISEKTPVAVS